MNEKHNTFSNPRKRGSSRKKDPGPENNDQRQVQDATEHVHAENNILKLKRMYATLSQVNHVIVRVRERDELFQRICGVAVRFGGFSRACICLLDEETGEVRPAAAHAADLHGGPSPTINLHQETYGSTLVATAIRTSRIVTSEDIHADPCLHRFTGERAPYPYYASAVVPLRLRGKIMGVLMLCSPEKGLFQDQAEVDLLEELGMDISFALDAMENENERQQSEDRFRNLVENMNDLVMEVDANGNYCYLSPNYAAASDCSPEKELGGSALKHIHPEDLPGVIQKLGQAFTSERQSATYRVQKRNGNWRWLETVGKSFRASDGSIHLITVARDITERKQAEEALKQNEHVLRLFVEHSPASIAMFDREMRYIVASRRYLADYRLPEQDLTGRSHYEVFPEIPERWKEIHRRCLEGEVEKMEEEPFLREDGTLDWVRWEIRPWYEEPDRVGGIILFSEVITERKQIQDDLRLLNLSLEQRVEERTMELSHASRAKDEFLANMSHELRTPLNAILGLSESLLEQRRGPLNERQVQSIELIASSGRHLLNLINDILEVSKIEAGKLQLNSDIVSVKELCISSLNFIKELALKKLIGVEFTCEESVSTFEADPQRVKQILINLLTNAVKFTPERGRVGLEVRTNAARDRILFSVTDTGIGIAHEDLKKLFTPFSQLDSSLARQYAGTGLGLSLVQKLTRAHGGSVEVESEVGKGSRFTVVLPLNQSANEKSTGEGCAPSAKIDQEAAPGVSPNNIVVLLAEDHQANADMILTYLESYGYTVLAARNGEEVLQMVEETTPDIILMDIQMPKMDGLETTQRLRQDPRFAATPIIALTGLVMPGDRESCFEAGVNEYLSKPVSLKTLVSKIEKLTGPQKSAIQL